MTESDDNEFVSPLRHLTIILNHLNIFVDVVMKMLRQAARTDPQASTILDVLHFEPAKLNQSVNLNQKMGSYRTEMAGQNVPINRNHLEALNSTLTQLQLITKNVCSHLICH